MSAMELARAALPPQLERMVGDELGQGERLLWTSQPLPARMARSSIPIVIFGIAWTALAVTWTAMASGANFGGGAPDAFRLFPLFGIPFILAGLGMLSSPWWIVRSARRTAYVITERRLIVFKGGIWSISVRSFAPEALGDIERKQHPDGSGDLVFAREAWDDGDGYRRSKPVGFLAVPDVKTVEEMVRALVEAARARGEGPG